MSALPGELLELVHSAREKYKAMEAYGDAAKNEIFDFYVKRYVCENPFDYLAERYVHDHYFDLAGHQLLWKTCGRFWNDTRLTPRSLQLDLEELVRGDDRVPNTYAQAARLVRGHMKRNKPRIRVPAPLQRQHQLTILTRVSHHSTDNSRPGSAPQ